MMDPQTNNRISNSQLGIIASPALVLAPVFFAKEELAEEMVARASETSLSAGPGLCHSPEIDPEEFESVYLWFIS